LSYEDDFPKILQSSLPATTKLFDLKSDQKDCSILCFDEEIEDCDRILVKSVIDIEQLIFKTWGFCSSKSRSEMISFAGVKSDDFCVGSLEKYNLKILDDESFNIGSEIPTAVIIRKDEVSRLKAALSRKEKEVTVYVRVEGETDKVIHFSVDSTKEEVYTSIAKEIDHPADQIQISYHAGLSVEMIKHSEDFESIIHKLRKNEIPRVLDCRKLSQTLEEYEQLELITFLLIRPDLDHPKENLIVREKDDRTVTDLRMKLNPTDMPLDPDNEVAWRTCAVQGGRVIKVYDDSTTIEEAKLNIQENNACLGACEVPVSGSGLLCSYFFYDQHYWKTKSVPGVLALQTGDTVQRIQSLIEDISGVKAEILFAFDRNFESQLLEDEMLDILYNTMLPSSDETEVVFPVWIGVDVQS